VASATKKIVRAAFNGAPDVLADFGLPPPKPRVVSPETKIAAAAKAKATREARGTKGKAQKAAIKGNPPATVTVPVAHVASTPSSPPAPAPAPTGNHSPQQ
jgi:hypothetical protein